MPCKNIIEQNDSKQHSKSDFLCILSEIEHKKLQLNNNNNLCYEILKKHSKDVTEVEAKPGVDFLPHEPINTMETNKLFGKSWRY